MHATQFAMLQSDVNSELIPMRPMSRPGAKVAAARSCIPMNRAVVPSRQHLLSRVWSADGNGHRVRRDSRRNREGSDRHRFTFETFFAEAYRSAQARDAIP